MQIYERNINSTVSQYDKDHIETHASLLDLNHSMRVSIRICLKTREIVEARAEIVKAPLGICKTTTALMDKLKGFRIERGINHKLVDALGTSAGCTHLYELALNAVRLSFNILMGKQFDWNEWIAKTTSDEEFIARAKPHLQGACLPFQEK